jgi:ABC-2 type transport system permease protein
LRTLLILWRRELTASFLSPVAYVTMSTYLFVAGWTFLQAVEANSGQQEMPETLLFVSVFFWLPLFVTSITMRLFAEEKRSGTIESLMTAPITDLQVVLGKFLGAFCFLVFAAVPAMGIAYLLQWLSPGITSMDGGCMLGGLLIFLAISGFCIAIGLLASLLTRNQIVAAIACFVAICAPFLIRSAGASLPFGSDRVLEYLSADTHIVDFSRGSIDTRPLVLYLSGTCFLLFTAVKVLESRRWR